MDESATDLKAKQLVKLARSIWIEAASPEDIQKAESIYNNALLILQPENHLSVEHDGNKDRPSPSIKTTREDELMREIQEKLALIKLQSNDAKKASIMLETLGYTCRLSQFVLSYPFDENELACKRNIPETKNQITRESPCVIIDNFLKQRDQEKLANVFADIKSSYWQDHSYTIDPPSPYFSFILPVESLANYGYIGKLSQQILDNSLLQKKFPTLKKANFIEMWAVSQNTCLKVLHLKRP